MAASDWEESGSGSEESSSENEESTPAVQPTKTTTAGVIKKNSKWADEDAEAEVPDSWSASESDDDTTTKAPPKPKGPIRNKGITKQKIAEKEAEDEQRLLQEQASRQAEHDPIARKQREQKQTLAADLENTRSLFGDAASGGGPSESPLTMKPKTKDEWDELSTSLATHLISQHGNKPLYPSFIEHFIKQLIGPLNDVQCRKVASIMTTLANEKQRQAKESAKKGGASRAKAKPTLGGVGSSASVASKGGKGLDLNAYDAPGLDDDYDFM